jgi:hypothetical protein
MKSRQPWTIRWRTAARWPAGSVLAIWRYLWRTTPMHRSEVEGDPSEDMPPPLPDSLDADDLQPPESGHGPLFHRLYRTRIRDSRISVEELIDSMAENPDCVAPSEFATFQKLRGHEGQMRPNDDYIVRMAAPWDGPVRVVDVRPDRFRLATLDGHLEAGQIEFRASRDEGSDLLVFDIESWARSKDRITDLLYHHLRLSKEVQLHMWISTLERIVEHTKGRMTGGIEVRTRVVPSEALSHG